MNLDLFQQPRPDDAEIIRLIMDRYSVSSETAIEWLVGMVMRAEERSANKNS